MNQVELIGLLSGLVCLLRNAEKVGIDVADKVTEVIHHKLPQAIPGSFVLYSGVAVENPTPFEINIGQNRGKLDMIKEYKTRTGRSLMEAKQACEQYFEAKGMAFHVFRY